VLVLAFPAALVAQSSEESSPSADTVKVRIERARALVAAHQLETAASELESVRSATKDSSVHSITSIMLMNIYLEAGNYGRAEALLEENFRSRSSQNGGAYFALAGQAVNGARTHLARYRGLGINTSAQNLPPEAVKDLDRLRSFLERMIVHAKEITGERKAYDSLSLLEDVLGIRLSLARDAEEQAKWSSEYSGARELLASQTQITSPNGISPLPPSKASAIKAPSPYSSRRSPEVIDGKAADKSNHSALPSAPSTPTTTGTVTPSEPKLTDFGLLNFKASKRVLPRYPPLAKQTGTTGLVRVHVIVDETGKVVDVSRTEGPLLLRQVAEDAAREWFFEGLTGPGHATPAGRFMGYIDFNFTL
jgi:TonB-like protein